MILYFYSHTTAPVNPHACFFPTLALTPSTHSALFLLSLVFPVLYLSSTERWDILRRCVCATNATYLLMVHRFKGRITSGMASNGSREINLSFESLPKTRSRS
jgi:hypothetical protein